MVYLLFYHIGQYGCVNQELSSVFPKTDGPSVWMGHIRPAGPYDFVHPITAEINPLLPGSLF
jgi:hypothetical protein